MKNIGVYIRVSTEEQARIQDGSLVSQRNRIIEYVEYQNKFNKNWGEIIEFYVEEGKSAKNMNRPELKRMLSDVQSGRINLIISTELSRISRNIRDFCEVWDLLKKHSCNFITLREQFDTTTAIGEMMIFGVMNNAQFERKQTAERISANWASRAKRGLFNGGTIPLGYDRNPKNKGELIINEDEAKTVQRIYELFLAIGSVRKTQEAITGLGIYNKQFTNKHGIDRGGKPFSIGTLQSLLTNKIYIAKRKAKTHDGVIEINATWKPIIDELTFKQVSERLEKNKNKYKPDDWKNHTFALTELVQCGECGKSMGGKSGTGRKEKHFYYGHAQIKNPFVKAETKSCQIKNVRAFRLEELILKSLRQLLNEKGLIEKWINIYKSKTTNDLPEIQSRQKQLDMDIQTTGKRISNLVQRVSELPSDVPADQFYEQIKQMTQKQNELKLAKENLRHKSHELMKHAIDETALKEKIQSTLENLDQVSGDKQRPILSNLIKFIEINPTKIKMGIFAPTELAATGTEGSNQKLEKEGKLIPLSPNRAGSSTAWNGARSTSRDTKKSL